MSDKQENVHWPSAAVGAFEDEHDIDIIAIRAYGSRAKNMEGPNSDTDAMFIFDQPAMNHKLLGEYVDTIHTEKHGVDFQGWNIRKFADLLADSNPAAMEFLNSEERYYTLYPTEFTENLLDELRRYANRNFNPIRLYMHYRSMAKGNYHKYILNKIQNKESKRRYHILAEEHDRYIIDPIDEPTDEAEEIEEELREHLEDMNTSINYAVRLEPHRGFEIDATDRGVENQGFIMKRAVGEDAQFKKCTTDRTVRRNLKVIRATLCARHIRRTHDFPEMDFQHFLKHHVESGIVGVVRHHLVKKQQGEGDEVIGNSFKNIIESEINYDVDYEDLNRRGIDKERVNDFIKDAHGLLY